MTNTASMSTEPATSPGFDPTQDEMFSGFWASVNLFLDHPKDVKDQSHQFQHLIATLGRIADSKATKYKSKEGALTREISRALLDVSEMPLFRKREKRKNTEITPKQPKKAKTLHNNGPEEVMYSANVTTPDTPPPPYTPEDEPSGTSPPTNDTKPATTARAAPFPLSPSKKGDHWATLWASIISQAPTVNPANGKEYTWPANLTNVLQHIWGPGGVGNSLDMAQTVIDNFGLYSTDADYVVGPDDSPTIEIEIRVKRILALSKHDLVQQTELVLEYQRLAETFCTPEHETRDNATRLRKLWAAREVDPRLEVTEQARANFVMNRVVSSMSPEEMTTQKRREEMKKFRREREFAFNIAMFIRLFGWGVVPLLARAPWRQVLGNVPSSIIVIYLSQLSAAVPTLRQICDCIDANFFQYMRKPGAVKKISKTCFQELEIKKKKDRTKQTMAWLFAASGQLEEPGSVFEGSGTEMVGIEKDKSVLGGHTHQTGEKGVEEDTFDDFDDRKYVELVPVELVPVELVPVELVPVELVPVELVPVPDAR
ncbi:hypothetical protein KCU73_g4928, partial [Aureobasidium melanogenum]